MEAKLIKTEVNYLLENEEGVIIASTSLKNLGLSLSLKNCQAVELGVDLDTLVLSFYPKTEWDVEICNIMDCIGGNPCNGTSFECNHCTNIGEPKLDADDCLILKRI